MIRRRKYLTTISATVGGLVMAGCSGSNSDGIGSSPDCTIEESIGNVEPVSVTVDGQLEEATHEADLRWNSRTQAEIEAPLGTHTSDEDEKFLVFRFEITNPTDTTIQIGQTNFAVTAETPDTVDETGPTFLSGMDLEQLNRVQLKPDGTIDSQIIFEIPTNTTSATVQADRPQLEEDDGAIAAFNPECDESLSFDESTETSESDSSSSTEQTDESDTTEEPDMPSMTPEEFIDFLVNTVYDDPENRFQNTEQAGDQVRAVIHRDRLDDIAPRELESLESIADESVDFELSDTEIIEDEGDSVSMRVVYIKSGNRIERIYELQVGPERDAWYVWDVQLSGDTSPANIASEASIIFDYSPDWDEETSGSVLYKERVVLELNAPAGAELDSRNIEIQFEGGENCSSSDIGYGEEWSDGADPTENVRYIDAGDFIKMGSTSTSCSLTGGTVQVIWSSGDETVIIDEYQFP